ncbi:glycosyltransferase family 2 protein [Ammoniphilus sp. 3BR4]|uniref:glycosyltransferase family 2 protein n=1 Tax=Ammoniphilus sp. 3BR4 TaxID=3158265 RepID=UPI003466BFE0
MLPLISIHIVTFNSSKEIADCLKCVLSQSGAFRKRVYILDNASTDETLKTIEAFSPDEVTVVKSEKNLGYAGGHNYCIRQVEDTDYILTLNPDVKLQPGYIQNILELMSKRPTVGMASGLLLRSDEITIDSLGIGAKKNRSFYDIYQDKKLTSLELNVATNFGPCGAAAVYSRRFVEDLTIQGQFFDEDFFAYKEDVDIAWRGQLFGWDSIIVPHAKGIHERGWKKGNRKKINKTVKIHSFKNRYLLMVKNDFFINILIHLPWLLFYEIMAMTYLLMREPYLIKSWLQFIKLLPKACIKRKKVMERKKATAMEIRKWFK